MWKKRMKKTGLKLNIKKTKIMTLGSITTWQIEGEKVEAVTRFIFLGSNITTDGDCSHEIKRYFLLGGKAMTNLDSMLKSRDISLLTMVCIVKAVAFPVVMFGCENCAIKEAAHQIIDAFKLCCRRLLRVPWTARRSNQWILMKWILKEIFIERTDAEAEAPMLWPPDVKSQLIGKDPDAGKELRQKEKRVTEDEMVR